jgi:hypothetical protein
MATRIPTMIAATALFAAASAHGDRAATPARVDPKADALLRAMSKELAGMKTFRCDTHYSTQVVTKEGQKLSVIGESNVAVARPNKMRSDRTGPRADLSMYYDGKTVTVFEKNEKRYASVPAPPTLDKMIDFARDKYDLDAPAADLLYADPYAALMDDVVSGMYVGAEPIGNRTCHHLAYRNHETDWQIWIEDGEHPLPCRYEITSKQVTGQPAFAVTLSRCKEEPALPPDTFAFSPPNGANKIDITAIAKQQPKRGA